MFNYLQDIVTSVIVKNNTEIRELMNQIVKQEVANLKVDANSLRPNVKTVGEIPKSMENKHDQGKSSKTVNQKSYALRSRKTSEIETSINSDLIISNDRQPISQAKLAEVQSVSDPRSTLDQSNATSQAIVDNNFIPVLSKKEKRSKHIIKNISVNKGTGAASSLLAPAPTSNWNWIWVGGLKQSVTLDHMKEYTSLKWPYSSVLCYDLKAKGRKKCFKVGSSLMSAEELIVSDNWPEEVTIQVRSNGNPGWIESFLVTLLQSGGLYIEDIKRINAYKNGVILPPLYMLVRQKQKETRGQPGQKPENKMAGGPSRANGESPSSLELLKEQLMDARQQNQRLLETIEELKTMMVQGRLQRAQDQEAMEFLRQEITAMRKERDEARAQTTPAEPSAEKTAPAKNSAEKSAAAENSTRKCTREVHGRPEMREVRRQSPFLGLQEAPHDPREVCQLRGISSCQLQGVPQVPQEASSEAPSSQAHDAAAQSSPEYPPSQANNQQPHQLRPGRKRKAADQAQPTQSSPRQFQANPMVQMAEMMAKMQELFATMGALRNELLEIADRLEPDIIAIQETKMDSRHEFRMRGYKVYRQDRNYRGGGVAVLVKSNIKHHQTRAGGLGNLEVIGVEIQLPRREPLHVLSCYQPPLIPLVGEDLGDLFPDAQQVIAIGDYNAKSQQWNSRRLNARGRELEGFLDTHPEIQPICPPEPTQQSANNIWDVLDIALAGNIPYDLSIANHREGSSDHDPILLTVWGTHTDNTIHTRKITDWGAFRAHLQTQIHDITLIHNTEELDLAVLNLETDIKTSLVHSTVERQEPRREKCLGQISEEAMDLIRARRAAKKRAWGTRDPADRQRWNSYLSELDPVDPGLWKTQKILRTARRPIPPIHGERGLVYTKQDKAEAFADNLKMQCRENPIDEDLKEWERTVERRIDGQKQKETRGQPGQKPENKMAGGPSRANESPSSLELLKEQLMDARQKNQRLLETIEELKSMMVQARHQRAQDQEAMEFLRQEITAMRKERDEARAQTTPAEPSAEKSVAAENSAEFTHPPKTRSQRRKAKRTKLDNPTSSSESDSEMEVEPAQESTTGRTSQPPQPTPAPPPKDHPPVILRIKDHWTWSPGPSERRRSKLVTDGIRIFPASTTDYRQITKILAEAKVGFHTYSLPEEKQLRIVIRGLSEDLPETEIKEDLQDQGYQPTTIQRMRNRGTKNKMPLVLVQFPEAEVSILTALRHCCMLTVRFEKQRASQDIGQCHRCQRFGHAQGKCAASPKCVKCEEQHHSTDCKKPPTTPAKCANCDGPHPASYKGCPKYPKKAAAKPQAARPTSQLPTAQRTTQPRPTPSGNPSSYAQAARGRQQTNQPKPTQPKAQPKAAHQFPVNPMIQMAEMMAKMQEMFATMGALFAKPQNELLEIADRLDPDVIAIQETKIDSRHEFRMRGYRVYRQDRNIRGGGVAVLVKSNITHHQTRAGGLGNLEVIGIEIHPPMIPLLGEDLGDLFPGAQQVIAIGDFNAKSRQWNSRRLNARGRELEGFLDAHPEIQPIGPQKPTQQSANNIQDVLDIALDGNIPYDLSIANHREGSSDHDPILLTVWGTHTDNIIHTRKITEWGAFRAHLQTHIHDITHLHNTEERDLAVLNLETDIKTSLVHSTVERQELHSEKCLGQISEEAMDLIRARRAAKRRAWRARDPADRRVYNQYTRLDHEELGSLRQERWNSYLSELDPADPGLWKTQKILRTSRQDALSGPRTMEAGVPQGAVLSPHLFAIYTSDVPKTPRTSTALYADDTAFLARSRRAMTAIQYLQEAVDQLEGWCDRWKISINAENSKSVLFRRCYCETPGNDHVTYGGENISWTDTVKYLGVTMDRSLTWRKHIESTVAKGKACFHKLYPMIGRHSQLDLCNKLLLIRQVIQSQLTYAATAWGYAANSYQKRLQSVENVALRCAVNAPRYVRNADIIRDLQYTTTTDTIKDRATKFFAKIDAHTNPLVRAASDYDPGGTTQTQTPKLNRTSVPTHQVQFQAPSSQISLTMLDPILDNVQLELALNLSIGRQEEVDGRSGDLPAHRTGPYVAPRDTPYSF
ncbi:hypothetical protein NQ317_001211 [Molorchus minor]|uniref:Reverse transcriptase n=1 Tax=Molorchus minor TaxID=1323400 RepID=A0ABQ9JUD4_9CUCU|nr:hypothetical protein NQ317_001211 [Molorchus minor]